ncbi:MAG: 50S ribosome-binding GTPase [Deltaproteobacteria bacterium]|nr:50S ribosome-binding GTPase [Deltaproteobacteria bacterium]
MSRKLDDLMRSIEQIAVGESAASEVAWGSRALADLYRRLTEGGVADEAAALVIREAAARLDEEGRADEFRALDAVAGEIMRRVRIADPFADVGRRQVVCALVGPTGVGKTTTIAKLAGAQVLEHGRKAAFLTTDTFRVGAVDQLRAYARILGVPLDVAVDDNDLSEKIARHADKDVIFIDTQGVGQKDAAMMRRLAGYFERMRQVDLHLIVSATTQASDLEDIAESYREFPVASVIASKLDESNELGGIYTLLAGRNQSASFFTVGQKVPEDIETATRERVVDRLLGITAH